MFSLDHGNLLNGNLSLWLQVFLFFGFCPGSILPSDWLSVIGLHGIVGSKGQVIFAIR